MIAHIYLRYSHSDQGSGTSIARQRKLCLKVIEARGWTLGNEYLDQAKSASKGHNRREGGRLFDFESETAAGLHHGEALVCEKIDRISRQGYDATRDLIRGLNDNGVTVVSEDGGFYEPGRSLKIEDVMVMLIRAETAREEAAKRADRTRERHEINRMKAEKHGLAVGKLAPAWLTIANQRYVAIPERAELVIRIFEMADAGDGALTIARKLNEEGVPVWQRWKKRPIKAWDRTRIRKILSDDAVLGWRRGKGEPIKLYPQIVDADLFARVRAGADDRAATKGGARSSVVANLVSGITSCTVCGSKMMYLRDRAAGSPYVTKPAGNVAYLKHDAARLICRSAYHKKCSNRSGIAYHGFEKALLDACLHLALDDRAFVRSDELQALNRLLAEKEHSLAVTRSSAERLWKSWAESEAKGEPSRMREELAQKAESESVRLAREIEELTVQKNKAAGQADAAEHLSRIEDIRSHLYDPDLTVRATHRKKVMAGLRSVISHIWMDENRVATVGFAGGLAALQIKRGKVIKKADASAMFRNGDYTALGDDQTQRAATLLVKRAKAAA